MMGLTRDQKHDAVLELERRRLPVRETFFKRSADGTRIVGVNKSDEIPPDLMDVSLAGESDQRSVRFSVTDWGQWKAEVFMGRDKSVSGQDWERIMDILATRCRRLNIGGISFPSEAATGEQLQYARINEGQRDFLCAADEKLGGLKMWFKCDGCLDAAWRQVQLMLPDRAFRDRAGWAVHIAHRFESLIEQTPRAFGGDLHTGGRSERWAFWENGRFTYNSGNRRDDSPAPYFRMTDFDFSAMTMKVNGKTRTLKARHLAYLMSFGGEPARYVREGIGKAWKDNPFIREVLPFLDEAALLMRCSRGPSPGPNGSRAFIPYMEMGTLMESHSWNEFFSRQYPEAEKAGCNFNRLSPWQSVSLLLASDMVREKDRPILFNDGAALLRERGKGDISFTAPRALIVAVIAGRCSKVGSLPGGLESIESLLIDTERLSEALRRQERTGIPEQLRDTVRIPSADEMKTPLSLRSVSGYREIHDEMSRRLSMIQDYRRNNVKVPENSCFNDLRRFLPEDFEWLKTKERLVSESEEMHHCVRTYGEKVSDDRCAIYSVIRDDKRYTIEFSPPAPDGRYGIVQVRGRRNEVDETAHKLKEEIREYLDLCVASKRRGESARQRAGRDDGR